MFPAWFSIRILPVFLLALALSCSHDGALEIDLDVEVNDTALNPLRNPALSAFTLTLTSSSSVEQGTETYLSGDHRMGFGNIPTGIYSSASIAAKSYSGALVAYGEFRNRFRIGPSDPTRIEVPLRFPFIFATGGTELPVLHPELDSSLAAFDNIMVGTPADITSATAVSPDGRMLAVLTANASGTVKLWMYMTGNHQKVVEFQLARPDRVSSLQYSPDGSTLLLLSETGDWASFLNVSDFLEGANRQGSFHYQEVSSPIAAGFFSEDSVVILSSTQYRHDTCDAAPSSALTWFLISQPLQSDGDVEIAATNTLSAYASALTVDIAQNRLYLAHPCSTEITAMRPGTTGPSVVLALLNLSPCLRPVRLLADSTMLTVACVTAADTVNPQWSAAKLLLQRYTLTPQLSPNARTLVLDYPSEPVAYKPSTMPAGTSLLILQAPERVLPRFLGMSAQGTRLVVAAEAYYRSSSIPVGSSSLEETRSKSHSVLFVDPRLAMLDRRVRTACFPVDNHLDDTPPEGGFSGSYCSDNMGSIETTSISFIPTQLSIVYGTP
ncbi:WD40 repeat domain-containing protein [Myxococcota bacterium]|nr:WD40 repeat domain-containing protein [Myxococcota bacterium]MBU1413840.1 WD40 repeat domain-containing protein [Myxococcota bacterium]